MRSAFSDFYGTPAAAHVSFDSFRSQVNHYFKHSRTIFTRENCQQMSSDTSSTQATASQPEPVSLTGDQAADPAYHSSISPSVSSGSSASSSESESPSQVQSSRHNSRRSRMDRPRLGDRQRSNTIIVPKGRDVVQTEKRAYPPDDARAMSPRRNSEDIERLERGVRESLKE